MKDISYQEGLGMLLANATQLRKEHYKRHRKDPSDRQAIHAYYYEEGRARAYRDALSLFFKVLETSLSPL